MRPDERPVHREPDRTAVRIPVVGTVAVLLVRSVRLPGRRRTSSRAGPPSSVAPDGSTARTACTPANTARLTSGATAHVPRRRGHGAGTRTLSPAGAKASSNGWTTSASSARWASRRRPGRPSSSGRSASAEGSSAGTTARSRARTDTCPSRGGAAALTVRHAVRGRRGRGPAPLAGPGARPQRPCRRQHLPRAHPSRWLVDHGVHAARTHGTQGQPTRPRDDELRSADRRSRQSRDHGRGAGRGHQLLRHRQRLRLGREQGPTETIIGNWFAKGGGRREKTVIATKVVRQHGPRQRRRLAQPRQALRGEHPARGGRQPEAVADRLHRPLPVPPHRPEHPVRGDLRRRSTSSSSRARSSTPAPATSPGTRSPRPTRSPPAAAAPSAWSASSACTTSPSAAPRWRSSRPRRTTASGSSPWSPLHGGLLGGIIKKEVQGGRRASGRAADTLADPTARAQIQAYEDLLDKHGLEPGEVALAWLLTRPGVTGPIVGPRTAEQLRSALRAVELDLSEDLLTALDEIFPGPGPSPGGLRLVRAPKGRPAQGRGAAADMRLPPRGRDRPQTARSRRTGRSPRPWGAHHQPLPHGRRHGHHHEHENKRTGHDPVPDFRFHASSLTGPAQHPPVDHLVPRLLPGTPEAGRLLPHQCQIGHGPAAAGELREGRDIGAYVHWPAGCGPPSDGPCTAGAPHRHPRPSAPPPPPGRPAAAAPPRPPRAPAHTARPWPNWPPPARAREKGAERRAARARAVRQGGYDVVGDLAVEREGEVPAGAGGPAQPAGPRQLPQPVHLRGEFVDDVLGGSTAAKSLMSLTIPDPGRHDGPMAITIREGGPDDLPVILGMLDSSVEWLVSQGRTAQWGTQPLSRHEKTVAAVARAMDEGTTYLAEWTAPGRHAHPHRRARLLPVPPARRPASPSGTSTGSPPTAASRGTARAAPCWRTPPR